MADIIYPYKKYNYKVLIDNNEAAGFSEVSAPDISSAPVEYREDNMAGMAAGRQPGIIKYGTVTMKNGVTSSQLFVDWMKTVLSGKVERKTVVVILTDDAMTEVASWRLEKAWPTKYAAPDLNAAGNEVAIESLELVTEGVIRTR